MTVLDRILADVRRDLEARMTPHSYDAMRSKAETRPAARDFRAAIGRAGVSLIAEVKKASPSLGPIRPDLDAVEVAMTYAGAGADAISMLTESRYFGGSLDDLSRADETLDRDGPPLLQKDFIVDPYQVYEARAHGADCVLLIAALLCHSKLAHLLQISRELGMASLVETHDEADVARAVACGSHIIGINSRDLHTLEVDLATFERLRSRIPPGTLVVAESGVRGRNDVGRIARVGVDAVLVGEAIMSARDMKAKIGELRCDA